MAPQVRWIEDLAELEAIAPAWDALAATLDPTPFSLSPCYLAWWDAYSSGRRARVCTVWDGGDLVALLPTCERGGRLETMANEESCVVRPLARDAGALRMLADAVTRTRHHTLEIRRLPEDDPSIAVLTAAARAVRRWSLVEPDISSPIVDTTGTLDEYRLATRSKWHKNLRRLYRKLERDHGARLRLISAPTDLHAELAQGFEVESSGWKRAAGSGIRSRPETETYYLSLGRRFHERGELRLSSISVGDRLIAWDLGILHRNRLYSPKSGYLEEFKPLAPGLVLELATIERCFELGLDAHELLGADEAYKLRFSTSVRRHRYFRAYARRPSAATRYAWRRLVPPGKRAIYSERLRPRLSPSSR